MEEIANLGLDWLKHEKKLRQKEEPNFATPETHVEKRDYSHHVIKCIKRLKSIYQKYGSLDYNKLVKDGLMTFEKSTLMTGKEITTPLKTHVTLEIGKALELVTSDSEEEEGFNPPDANGKRRWRKCAKEPIPQGRSI